MSDQLGADYGWLDQATNYSGGLASSEELAYLESLVRRLGTPNGSISYWPNYGTDLRQFLLDTPPDYVVANAAERECYKDQRTQSAKAAIEWLESTLLVTISVETESAAFVFVMSVSTAEAKLVSLQKVSQ